MVIDDLGAVQAAGVQTGCFGNAHGCGVIPLVLATGVDVRIVISKDHGDSLGATAAHGDELHAQLICHELADLRWGVAADHQAVGGGSIDGAHLGGEEHGSQIRHAHGSVGNFPVLCQRDMHGPVLANRSKLAGSIERINDPHALHPQAFLGIWSLFGEHGIIRAVLLQAARNPVLSLGISGVSQGLAAQETYVSHTLENFSGAQCKTQGEGFIIEISRHNLRF